MTEQADEEIPAFAGMTRKYELASTNRTAFGEREPR
jgi:hypothetical protein